MTPGPVRYLSLGFSSNLSRQSTELEWNPVFEGSSSQVLVDISDAEQPVVLSLVVEIDKNHFAMTSCGNWSSSNITTPSFTDITLSCVGKRPECPPFDTAWDHAMKNLHAIQEKVLKYPGASTMNSFETVDGLKFRHSLFDRVDKKGKRTLEAVDADLGPAFTLENWPHETPDAGKERDRLGHSGTHRIMPLMAFNKDGHLIEPEEYGRQLPGAIAKIDFILKHTEFNKGLKHDAFEAMVKEIKLIEPPHGPVCLVRPALKRTYSEYTSPDNTYTSSLSVEEEHQEKKVHRPSPEAMSCFDLQDTSFLDKWFRSAKLTWKKDPNNQGHHFLVETVSNAVANLQGTFKISENDPHQRLNAAVAWDHAQMGQTMDISKIKRACVGEKPTTSPYDQQNETTVSNLHAMLDSMRQYRGSWDRFESRHNGSSSPSFTFRSPVFVRRDSSADLGHKYDNLPHELKDDQFPAQWHVDDKTAHDFHKAVQDFVIEPLPAVDENGQTVEPRDYLLKLQGAIVKIVFTLEHYAIQASGSQSGDKHDTFTATIQNIVIVQPPSPENSRPVITTHSSMIQKLSQEQ